jgi:alkanesulfonate monooxygenase SsuD/methylene tetrahydromethanopterin reductase-like flavin-dependent oxidoreductase (luciferase family)
MEAASLHRMFPGRAMLGVGHGVRDWMGQVGARLESPLTLLRENLLALRALLGGERVTVDGRYVRLDDVVLDWPPHGPRSADLAGATGPRSLRLTGEAADGTILTASTNADGVAEHGSSSRRGALRPGVRPDPTPSSSICSPPPGPTPTPA